jgi:hypothetical protein
MYAKYVYNASSDKDNILADILALLTGETNKANLSADCNQTGTEIVATVAAGWTLHDASAGTSKKAIKAAVYDDATTYKNVVLDASAAGYLKTVVYETWNEVSHSGTNKCYDSDSSTYSQRIDVSGGGTLYVFSSERFLVLASQTAAGWANSSYSGPTGCLERSRDLPFDTVAAGWPNWFHAQFGRADYNASYFGNAPRRMKKDETTVTGGSANYYVRTVGWDNLWTVSPSGIDQKIPDGTGGFLVPFYPGYCIQTYDMPAPYGEFSSLCDVWRIPSNIASHLDTITKNGVDYLVLKLYGANEMMVIRKE